VTHSPSGGGGAALAEPTGRVALGIVLYLILADGRTPCSPPGFGVRGASDLSRSYAAVSHARGGFRRQRSGGSGAIIGVFGSVASRTTYAWMSASCSVRKGLRLIVLRRQPVVTACETWKH